MFKTLQLKKRVSFTLWRRKMNDISVALEHVDFLNGLDRLYIELFECRLQFLVVGSGTFVHLLDFPAGCAFASTPALLAHIPHILRLCHINFNADNNRRRALFDGDRVMLRFSSG